jgi:hypothetical protein
MKPKRAIAWGVGVSAFLALGVYGEFVREAMQFSPSMLLVWIDGSPSLSGWTCKQILIRNSLKPEQVVELNQDAGTRYPIYLKSPELAEEMLSLFIARGVDVNAGNERTRHWTALHGTVFDGKPDRVAMLLRHGARVDVRGTDGMSPLDYARREQQKALNDPNRAEIVRLLEEAEKQLPAAK